MLASESLKITSLWKGIFFFNFSVKDLIIALQHLAECYILATVEKPSISIGVFFYEINCSALTIINQTGEQCKEKIT